MNPARSAALALALAAISTPALAQQRAPGAVAVGPRPNAFVHAVPDIDPRQGMAGASLVAPTPAEPAPTRMAEMSYLQVIGMRENTVMLRVSSGERSQVLLVQSGQTLVLDGRELVVALVGTSLYDKRLQLRTTGKPSKTVYEAALDAPEPVARSVTLPAPGGAPGAPAPQAAPAAQPARSTAPPTRAN